MCQLDNQVTDESSNLIYRKKTEAKQLMDSAYIEAEMEMKKQGMWKIHDNIQKSKNRFNPIKKPKEQFFNFQVSTIYFCKKKGQYYLLQSFSFILHFSNPCIIVK
jgi:hypothetical protein